MKDFVALARQYEADVLSGTIPVCRWVRLAVQRNVRDLARQNTADFPYRFDPEAASRICRMAEMLPHIKGPLAFVTGQDEDGRNLWNTLTLEPWQCWVLTTVFGWRQVDGRGLRRFRTMLLLVPRKNGKSFLGAVIALYMLTADEESGAEVYSAATTRDQAKVVAETAWEMALRSPAFREYFGVKLGSRTTRSLSVPETASKFMPLSSDANSLDGLNISCAVVDELHAHPTRALSDVIETGTGARLQPLVPYITTAGVAIGGICDQKRQYLHKVLEGTADDPTFFGAEYTVDEGDDWRLSETHRKANPNYAVSVQPDDLLRKVREAEHSQAAINNFLTKHLNVWVRSESGWMLPDLWNACVSPSKVRLEDLREHPCWIGVDLGETRDPSSLAILFKTGADTYVLIPRIYMPAAAVAQSPIAQLSGWVREGWIIETPGNEADYARIESDLLDLMQQLTVKEIDFDRRSARLMMQDLRARLEPSLGRDRVEQLVLDIPQSVDIMDPAMKRTEALVLAKKLQHDGNPAMAWMIGNIVVERNHKGEIYPRKAGGKDSPNKIDGPVAFFTALSQAMRAIMEPEFQMFFAGGRK